MGNEPRSDDRNQARERFFALLEDELADERALSEDEILFKERAVAEDSECRAFAAALEELQHPQPVAPAAIERAIREHERTSRDSRRRGLIAFAVTTAAVAAVALIVVVTALRDRVGERASAPTNGPAFSFAADNGPAADSGAAGDAAAASAA